jgi:hypothetical protein
MAHACIWFSHITSLKIKFATFLVVEVEVGMVWMWIPHVRNRLVVNSDQTTSNVLLGLTYFNYDSLFD